METGKEAGKPWTPRRFTWLPTLDIYVLREFLVPFSVLIIGFVLLFLIADVFNDLSDFLRHEAELGIIARYFMLKLPGNIRFILPISLLLACMYTMANFGKNLEITAMRASGISLQRCCLSIYIAALLVTGVNFWFNEQYVPATERQANLLRKKIKLGEHFDKIVRSMLTYRSPDERRTWLFSHFDTAGIHRDVMLKYNRSDGTLDWDIKAESASYEKDGWVFRNVIRTEFDAEGLLPGSPEPYKEFRPGKDLIPERPRDIENSVKPVEDLPSWVIIDLLRKTKNMSSKCRALYLTTLYHRLTFPWSCFIAALLGIPLATKNERGGIFLSIIVAIMIIMVYFVFSTIFQVLGNQGNIPPLLAGAGPTLAFIVYGWYNVIRQN